MSLPVPEDRTGISNSSPHRTSGPSSPPGGSTSAGPADGCVVGSHVERLGLHHCEYAIFGCDAGALIVSRGQKRDSVARFVEPFVGCCGKAARPTNEFSVSQ